MSDLKKIIKANIKNLFETKGFEEMESAFGVDKELSEKEKEQFDSMEEVETDNTNVLKQQSVPGTQVVDKTRKEAGKDAMDYYKDTASKMKKFQTADEKQESQSRIGESLEDTPKVDREESDEENAYEAEAYGTGMQGLKYDDEGSEKHKALEDRMDDLHDGDPTYKKLKDAGQKYKDHKYGEPDEYHNSPKVRVKEGMEYKEALNKLSDIANRVGISLSDLDQKTKDNYVKGVMKGIDVSNELIKTKNRPGHKNYDSQVKNENKIKMKYTDVIEENIFKANGKLVSEEQVLKIANKVPSRVKVDESVFAITDGENYYRLIWEGSEDGEPTITHSKNTQAVNESINKMKSLWSFDSKDSISTKKNIKESGDDAFKRMFNKLRETDGLVGEE